MTKRSPVLATRSYHHAFCTMARLCPKAFLRGVPLVCSLNQQLCLKRRLKDRGSWVRIALSIGRSRQYSNPRLGNLSLHTIRQETHQKSRGQSNILLDLDESILRCKEYLLPLVLCEVHLLQMLGGSQQKKVHGWITKNTHLHSLISFYYSVPMIRY
jgi:hypothetical protein